MLSRCEGDLLCQFRGDLPDSDLVIDPDPCVPSARAVDPDPPLSPVLGFAWIAEHPCLLGSLDEKRVPGLEFQLVHDVRVDPCHPPSNVAGPGFHYFERGH